MAVLDALIHDVATRFGLAGEAASLVREALALVASPPGGLNGFLDRVRKAGLGELIASWLGHSDAPAISASDLQRIVGAPALDSVAHRLGLALPASNTALAYVVPKLIGLLTPGRVVPAALPSEAAALLAPAVAAAPVRDRFLVLKIVGAALGVAIVAWLIWLFGAQPVGGPAPTAPATAEAPKSEALKSAEPAVSKAETAAVKPPAPAATEPPPAVAPKVAEAPKAPEAPAAAPPSAPATLALDGRNGAVQVSGAVHDEATRGSILDALKAAFGADKVSGDVTVDANRAPAPWLGGLGAALGALKVPGLSAAFEGPAATIRGALPQGDLFRIAESVKTALGTGTTVTMVPERPAMLAVDETSAGVHVSGAVHDEATRNTLLDSLKAAFGADQVSGDVTVDADRAAAPWTGGIAAALHAIKSHGLSAIFEGADAKIHGVTPQADLDTIAASVKSALGPAVTVEAIADAPATLTLASADGAVQVSGAVHDEATRGSILEALKAAFGADKVQGDVTVDAHRAAAPWLDKLGAALGALKAPGLSATFEGAAVTIHGALPEADLGKIADSLKGAFGSGVAVEARADAPPTPAPAAPAPAPAAAAPPIPAQLSIEDLNGSVQVSGSVRDDQTKSSILNALKAAFGADKVSGDVTVDPNRVAAPWVSKLGEALDLLKVPGLKAAFDGTQLHLGGAISDTELNRVADALKERFGSIVVVKTPSGASEETAAEANQKAEQALGALKAGFSAADLVAALNLTVINFATNSAEVPASQLDLLKEAAADIKQLPAGTLIEIAGYTDSTGDAASNIALSQRRADSVRKILVANGAPADMVVAKGFGAADPIASNDTAEGRFRNRRIEYHLKTP